MIRMTAFTSKELSQEQDLGIYAPQVCILQTAIFHEPVCCDPLNDLASCV